MFKEKPIFLQIGGVLAAFLGSVFIIKPGFQHAALLAALAGVVGGMGAGIAYTFVRALGQKGEDSRRIVIYFSAFSCLLCLPFFILQFQARLRPKNGAVRLCPPPLSAEPKIVRGIEPGVQYGCLNTAILNLGALKQPHRI